MGVPRTVVYGWLALLLVLWSANFIFARFALRELPLGLVLGFRYVFSAGLMLPVVAAARRTPAWREHKWNRRDLPALLTVGLLGLVGNQVLFVIGISMTSVAHAGVITTLSPVLVLLGSAARGHEHISRARIARARDSGDGSRGAAVQPRIGRRSDAPGGRRDAGVGLRVRGVQPGGEAACRAGRHGADERHRVRRGGPAGAAGGVVESSWRRAGEACWPGLACSTWQQDPRWRGI